MKSKDVREGATYAVKVSGKVVPVLITGPSGYGGWWGLNQLTERTVRIRSAQRCRAELVMVDGVWHPTTQSCLALLKEKS